MLLPYCCCPLRCLNLGLHLWGPYDWVRYSWLQYGWLWRYRGCSVAHRGAWGRLPGSAVLLLLLLLCALDSLQGHTLWHDGDDKIDGAETGTGTGIGNPTGMGKPMKHQKNNCSAYRMTTTRKVQKMDTARPFGILELGSCSCCLHGHATSLNALTTTGSSFLMKGLPAAC